MELIIRLPENARKKDVNMKLQRWENEGGHQYTGQSPEEVTPGLLQKGQKLEVLDTHIIKIDGRIHQKVEVKPINTKES